MRPWCSNVPTWALHPLPVSINGVLDVVNNIVKAKTTKIGSNAPFKMECPGTGTDVAMLIEVVASNVIPPTALKTVKRKVCILHH